MGEILKQKYQVFISRCRANGTPLLRFTCPQCNSDIETLAAPHGDEWNSISTCPFCDVVYMKVVTDADVEIQPLPGGDQWQK
ncbi:hypothetical protein ACULTK_004544 [Yersinia enterocolitica]|uniref:hypothetical protein n=1 Tax=Yersinia enterocolitica TaxID=630 RepID=UPI0021E931AF|nr:hypothetical protein [Yersinia enterocolitica]EKN3971057.1 hypothetical protein [Yersinia enterocolitica]ELI7909139.1 hypothetical protein [Yersinia enterocolitica]UYK00438.1 hypothetical protein N4221_14615 [Yersinia enterocolitica]HDL8516361.1 hypothetical protein [Yersinia enterocolitica]HDL8556151.1 hypothetical protein [Yersinia enterocolitica]